MTWIIYRKEYDGNHNYKEWSDSDVEQAAQKVKHAVIMDGDHNAFETIKEFLPQPIRDAL